MTKRDIMTLPNAMTLIMIIYLLISAVSMYGIIDLINNNYEPILLKATLLVVVVTLLLFAISKQSFVSFKKEYFRISTIFIIGYLIVFFQRYVDVVAGIADPNNSHMFVSPALINKCALLSIIGLLCFVIGYLIYRPSVIKSGLATAQKQKSLRWLNYILFVTVIFFIYNYGFYYLTNIYSQHFLDSHKGTIAAYIEVMIKSLMFSILILHTKNGRTEDETVWGFIKSLGLIFHLSLLAYLGLFLLVGNRGPIISIVLAYFFSYVIKVRPKFKLITYFFLIAMASFSLSVIGIVRQMNPDLAFYDRVVSTLQENTVLEKNSIIGSTAELSSSVRSLHYTVNHVPDKHPFLYGSFQFRELIAVIPFSNLVTKHLLDNSFKYRSSAAFITYVNQGEHYKRGDGSNVVADLYLSFGFLGVIIGLFLFGIFIKRLEFVIFTYHPPNIPIYYYCLAFAYISAAISIPRNTILSPLQTAFFSLLIILLYDFILKVLIISKQDDKNVKIVS